MVIRDNTNSGIENISGEKKKLNKDKRDTILSKLLDETVMRMANFPNPVELVNNMYGAHPGPDDRNYFEIVYGNL